MSERPADTIPIVLHIFDVNASRAATRDRCTWLAALEAGNDCAVVQSTDVYRALAQLGRDRDRPPSAILVCVDELTPAEDEFFTLARRLCRGVSIGIYAARPSRLDRYKTWDLRPINTDAELREWLAVRSISSEQSPSPSGETASSPRHHRATTDPDTAQQRPPTDSPHPENATSPRPRAVEVPLTPSANPVETDAPPPIVVTGDDDEEHDAADDRETAAHDETDPAPNTVRVPWLRYEGAPHRAAPEQPSSNNESSRTGRAADVRARQPYEPLLTDDELRALIGDDLTSLGPERPPSDRDEPRREEGAG